MCNIIHKWKALIFQNSNFCLPFMWHNRLTWKQVHCMKDKLVLGSLTQKHQVIFFHTILSRSCRLCSLFRFDTHWRVFNWCLGIWEIILLMLALHLWATLKLNPFFCLTKFNLLNLWHSAQNVHFITNLSRWLSLDLQLGPWYTLTASVVFAWPFKM